MHHFLSSNLAKYFLSSVEALNGYIILLSLMFSDENNGTLKIITISNFLSVHNVPEIMRWGIQNHFNTLYNK